MAFSEQPHGSLLVAFWQPSRSSLLEERSLMQPPWSTASSKQPPRGTSSNYTVHHIQYTASGNATVHSTQHTVRSTYRAQCKRLSTVYSTQYSECQGEGRRRRDRPSGDDLLYTTPETVFGLVPSLNGGPTAGSMFVFKGTEFE